MPERENIEYYIRGHLFDIASQEKIEEKEGDISSVVTGIIKLKESFNKKCHLQKSVLGILSKYKSEQAKKKELVSVSRKITEKCLI
ncbi:hypothetical protein AKJ51_00080 [candidate division MSBL1 archaeon SCGC-AAA382A20]|uniref:Uncharacterized protein n=1 Tax=candidate division MSBL1 archaeon SCGC-AAA382A20 TaxID=1698280 RepID=A0A133VMR0_9EURY|nr:hypothetical protein AKJ51_00080 [candidate division MSBL1 archaeon SCGC-AAA382A20]